MALYQDYSNYIDQSKNNATRGWGQLFLCKHWVNLKKFLVKNYCVNLKIISNKWYFGDPLPRLFKLQPGKYQLSKSIVHEIKFGDSCHENINNLPYSDRYFNLDRQIEMF